MTKIKCLVIAQPTGSSLPDDGERAVSAHRGAVNSVRVQGIDGCLFECFPDAHPGKDHEFRVGERILVIPWEKFRREGKGLFFEREVTWKELDWIEKQRSSAS